MEVKKKYNVSIGEKFRTSMMCRRPLAQNLGECFSRTLILVQRIRLGKKHKPFKQHGCCNFLRILISNYENYYFLLLTPQILTHLQYNIS